MKTVVDNVSFTTKRCEMSNAVLDTSGAFEPCTEPCTEPVARRVFMGDGWHHLCERHFDKIDRINLNISKI